MVRPNSFIWLILACLFTCTKHQDKPISWKMHIIDNTSSGADGTKLVDANNDGKMDIVTGWEQGNIARMYFHPGSLQKNWTYIEVIAPNVEDASPVDLDGDGFYDLVTCSEGKHMRVSFHWAPNNHKAYKISQNWKTEDVPATIDKTRWMFVRPMDIDGKNGIDLVVGSKDPNGTLGWLEAPENPRAVALWKYHEISPANWVMSIEIRDMDQDGSKDILISDRNGPNRGVRWLKNPGQVYEKLTSHWVNHSIGMTKADPLFLGIADENQDGLIEMWVPNLREYFMYFEQKNREGTVWDSVKLPIPNQAGSIGKSAAIDDIDMDGQLDLITTYDGAEGKSGVLWSSFDAATNAWIHQDVSGLEGIKYDYASLIDMDGDGDIDILTCEEANNSQKGPGLGVIWYENPTKPN